LLKKLVEAGRVSDDEIFRAGPSETLALKFFPLAQMYVNKKGG
jgi:hypothetical protein